MDYYINARTYEDKLAKLLAENNLLHTLDHRHHPMTLTITQNQAPDAQMEIWATADGHTSSQDSVLRFIFGLDGMEIQTNSRFMMTDALMGKIKGLAKKIEKAYKDAYFASTVNHMQDYLDDIRREDREADAAMEDFDGFYDDDTEDEPDDLDDDE